jgi:hypothetical protein
MVISRDAEMCGSPHPNKSAFCTKYGVRKFGVPNFCDTTVTDVDDFVRKGQGLITCVRIIGNLQTDMLLSFLIRYILREQK